MKTAHIPGVIGQDAPFLSGLLLGKGYDGQGIICPIREVKESAGPVRILFLSTPM
ncbi:MAG: hypothetical protein IJB00_03770 [Akkermansia sp.]|nr:hypothetical protein [Akkermansia sp.]